MSVKIPTHYNDLIYAGYEEYLNKGTPISHIATYLNEEWGTEFAESSMRGRYTQLKQIYENQSDDEDAQKRLYQLAKSSLKVKEERKIINKQRTLVDQTVREYAEKSLIGEIMLNAWGMSKEHNAVYTTEVESKGREEIFYSYADVHYDYNCDLPENIYNPLEAQARLWKFAKWLVNDVRENGYTSIHITDLGDMIEGTSLRISQLVRITMAMTEQARDYADIILTIIKYLSRELEDVKITYHMVSSDNHSQLRLFSTKRDEMPEVLALLITNEIKNAVLFAHNHGGLENITFDHGDEILIMLDGYNVVLAHGHQYGRNENILHSVEQRHQVPVHLFIAGHWHQFSIKYNNVKDGGQQTLIFLPSVVGDTDFSERLFLSCYPGFCKITIDLWHKIANAKVVRL